MSTAALSIQNRNNTNFPTELIQFLREAKWSSAYDFLFYHQNLVRYFVTQTDARGILVFHGTGMGKSLLAAAIAIDAMMGTSVLNQAVVNQESAPAIATIRDQPVPDEPRAIIGGAVDAIHGDAARRRAQKQPRTAWNRQVIVLLTKSLAENMKGEIVHYCQARSEIDKTFGASMPPSEIAIREWVERNFDFVSMNASNMLKQMSRAASGVAGDDAANDAVIDRKASEVMQMGELNDKLLIVDEAHNLFRAVTNGSANAEGLYKMIMRAKNIKLVFLTGTPIANDPFELSVCFNMLAGSIVLPEYYEDFHRHFVDQRTHTIRNREKFQNRLFGLVSHVDHTSTPGRGRFADDAEAAAATASADRELPRVDFPKELDTEIVRVPMTKDQYAAYMTARDRERTTVGGAPPERRLGVMEMARHLQIGKVDVALRKPGAEFESSYRVHSRQLGNYCPPENLRIRIAEFGADTDAARQAALEALSEITVESAKYDAVFERMQKHRGQLGLLYSQFVGLGGLASFGKYLVQKGYQEFTRAYLGSADGAPPAKPAGDEQEANALPAEEGNIAPPEADTLPAEGSPKSERKAEEPAVDTPPKEEHKAEESSADTSPRGERKTADTSPKIERKADAPRPQPPLAVAGRPSDVRPARRFAVISGGVPIEIRTEIIRAFTDPDNAHGDKIEMLLVSATGAEGIDLKNIRHVHILEPYWNYNRIQQVKARAIRNGSHSTLPPTERDVAVYIYIASHPADAQPAPGMKALEDTSDMELYNSSVAGRELISSFERALKEISIECVINAGPSCRVCAPTGTRLFSDSLVRDISAIDPCAPIEKKRIEAKTFKIGAMTYHYVLNPANIFGVDIFVYDPRVRASRPLPLDDRDYELIAKSILTAEAKR